MAQEPERAFPQLLRAAREGDAVAWEALYLRVSPLLLGWLRARTPEPEDVLAETWLRIVRDIDRFSGDEDAFRGWCFRIAAARRADQSRAGSRRRRLARRARDLVLGDERTEANDPAHEQGEWKLPRGRVARLVRTLAPDQREVLLLREVAELSIADTAAVMGRSEAAVKMLRQRALATLRERLEAESANRPLPVPGPER